MASCLTDYSRMAIRHLQLVVPELLSHLRNEQASHAEKSTLRALHHFLQHGERTRLWQQDDISYAHLESWQHAVLHALPTELRSHGLTSAVLTWRGEGGARREGSCLLVEPVHLQAGMDDLRYLQPPPLTLEEADLLVQSLGPLLSLAGFELLTATDTTDALNGNWYLWCYRQLRATTFSLRSHTTASVYDLMPQGSDAAELRRLMTEIQMVLHDHPVNRQRQRHGILAVNALWFSGNGKLDLVTQQLAQRVISDSAYMRGLCEQLQVDCWPVPPDAGSLLKVEVPQVLMVLPIESLTLLESRWLHPLAVALRGGDIEQLDLHLDQWRIRLRGGGLQYLRYLVFNKRHEMAELLA
jgi:hypothetical protein